MFYEELSEKEALVCREMLKCSNTDGCNKSDADLSVEFELPVDEVTALRTRLLASMENPQNRNKAIYEGIAAGKSNGEIVLEVSALVETAVTPEEVDELRKIAEENPQILKSLGGKE